MIRKTYDTVTEAMMSHMYKSMLGHPQMMETMQKMNKKIKE